MSEIEQVLVNEMTQTINKHILDRIGNEFNNKFKPSAEIENIINICILSEIDAMLI